MTGTDMEQSAVLTSKQQVKAESITEKSDQAIVLSVPDAAIPPDGDGSLADTNSRSCSRVSHELEHSEIEQQQDHDDNKLLKDQDICGEGNRSFQENQRSHCIKISGLHPQTTIDEIQGYFEYYGKVKDIAHFGKLSGEHADDSNDDVVDVYVIFHHQSPIDDILKQENHVHVIHDRKISLEVTSDSDDSFRKEVVM